MANAPDWVDDEVVDEVKRLTLSQERRLMRMTEALRVDATLLKQAAEIKDAVAIEDYTYARDLWSELTNEEQNALHIAPSFGGIFTTFEKKVIRGEVK